MPDFRVSKNDSADLAFALSCFIPGLITRDEFVAWVYWVIEHAAHDLPHFFYDLDVFETKAELYLKIGFVPSRELSQTQRAALFALAYRRGALTPEDKRIAIGEQVAPDAAETALAKTPGIEKEFREAFPFLTY